MVVEQGRSVGIDLGKRTWEMAIITRTGKFKTNERGDREPEEKTVFYKGVTTAEGRLKLYEKLEAGDKAALEDHHALIPLAPLPGHASVQEQHIFEIVLRSFFTVCMPDYIYHKKHLVFLAGAYTFWTLPHLVDTVKQLALR
jgi:DNA topoisomerase IA